MVDLLLTRVCTGGRHNQIGVIGEFEYLVNRMYRMQVGRSDNVRSWAYRRSLNNTGMDVSECRYGSGKFSAVSVVSKKSIQL